MSKSNQKAAKNPGFWFCAKVGAFHRGYVPWQCECGSSFCPGHEADHWVESAPAGAWVIYPDGF